MGFLKRAGLYCLRQRFRTAILFLVLTLIAASLLAGFAIRDAAKDAATDVQTAVGGKIILEIDMDGHMGSGRQNEWGTAYTYQGDLITQEIVDAIQKVEGVVDCNAEETAGYYGAGVNFKYLPAALGLSYTKYGECSAYTVTLSSEKCKAFQSGKYKLAAGRHFTPKDKYACLISKELADYNKLSVGDKIKLYSFTFDNDSIDEFEIVGIFDGTEGTAGNALTVDEIPANCGYIDYASVQEIFKEEQEDGYTQLTIYVEDPVSIQNVYDRISALPELKGKTLKLTIDTEEYEVVSAPLKSLRKSVDMAIILILAASVVILALLLTIWTHSRKREIGILLSIGKSKRNIVMQIFTEIFAIAAVSFAASVPFGNLIAGRAWVFFVSRAGAGAASLHVRMDAAHLLSLYIAGILLIMAAVLVSSWTITRLKPKDILKEYD